MYYLYVHILLNVCVFVNIEHVVCLCFVNIFVIYICMYVCVFVCMNLLSVCCIVCLYVYTISVHHLNKRVVMNYAELFCLVII